MRPQYFDIDPINTDADGIAESQTPAAGGSQDLTLDGTLADLGTAGTFDIYDAGYSTGIGGVKIDITSAGNDSARTFTVRGTDQDGVSVSEDVTGPNIGTSTTTKYFQTVTQITVDDDTAGAITVGTSQEIITPSVVINRRANDPFTVAVTGLSGTCQFDIDETFYDVYGSAVSGATWITNQSNKSADLTASLTQYATATRLKFDSYTSGAELQFTVVGQ